tara:strand:- start:531 stop:731 length:201 start_codon:yes stop_codon:yes gene_type:complete
MAVCKFALWEIDWDNLVIRQEYVRSAFDGDCPEIDYILKDKNTGQEIHVFDSIQEARKFINLKGNY